MRRNIKAISCHILAISMMFGLNIAEAQVVSGTVTGTIQYGNGASVYQYDSAGLFGPANRYFVGDAITVSCSYNTADMIFSSGLTYDGQQGPMYFPSGQPYWELIPNPSTFKPGDFVFSITDNGHTITVDGSGTMSNIFIIAAQNSNGQTAYFWQDNSTTMSINPDYFVSTNAPNASTLYAPLSNLNPANDMLLWGGVVPSGAYTDLILLGPTSTSGAAPAPEPATLAVLVTGLGSLAAARRRRRAAA